VAAAPVVEVPGLLIGRPHIAEVRGCAVRHGCGRSSGERSEPAFRCSLLHPDVALVLTRSSRVGPVGTPGCCRRWWRCDAAGDDDRHPRRAHGAGQFMPGPGLPVAYLLNSELTMALTWSVVSRTLWLTVQDGLRHGAVRGRGRCFDSDTLLPLPGGWRRVGCYARCSPSAGGGRAKTVTGWSWRCWKGSGLSSNC
jgi:hypothetical protein